MTGRRRLAHRARLHCGSRLGLAAALLLAASLADAEPLTLRYGLAPDQRWQAVYAVERQTRLGEDLRSERSEARFAYRVAETGTPGRLRLDARMLSQSVAGEPSPLDFSAIAFQAVTDLRGIRRGVRFEIGEATPPDLPGIEPDPVAFQQMLRRLAEAWLRAVYWLPELPEAPLAIGDSFGLGDREDVGGTEPGVRMEIASRTTYTLRRVAGRTAYFDVTTRSTVEAETAQDTLESRRRAVGEAEFDLVLGMWTRHHTRSEDFARFAGGSGGDGQASAVTLTEIEMSPGLD